MSLLRARPARRPSPTATGFVIPCQPVPTKVPPAGPEWLHEIKHDGFRLILRRDGGRVRAFTRRGLDWTEDFSAISAAACFIQARSFTIDGEAVLCGPDGVPVFDLLKSRQGRADAQLLAFDLIELDGEDLRILPLDERKARLAQLLARGGSSWLQVNPHDDGDGAPLFRAACRLGLEGIVSKRRDRSYSSGRCEDWRKVKNPDSPAVRRELEGDWGNKNRGARVPTGHTR